MGDSLPPRRFIKKKCFNCFSLCWSKEFHVTSCKCFIWMFHVFHTNVASVCFKCFICFQSYVAFMLQVFYVVRSGAGGRGTRRVWGPPDKGARGRWTRVLRSRHAGGVLVLSCSSWLLRECCWRRETRGSRRSTGVETRAECALGAGQRWTERAAKDCHWELGQFSSLGPVSGRLGTSAAHDELYVKTIELIWLHVFSIFL
jgi:hypothetical protein